MITYSLRGKDYEKIFIKRKWEFLQSKLTLPHYLLGRETFARADKGGIYGKWLFDSCLHRPLFDIAA